MKQYIHIIKMIPAALLICACSETDNLPTNEEEFGPQVEELTASLTSISAGAEVRATPTYIVNTPTTDPTTTSMETRGGWEMDVKIYKGNDIYTTHGEATYAYETSNGWKIQGENAVLRFPNYSKQKITATCRPNDWTDQTTPALDQSTNGGSALLAQDILIEKDSSKLYNPAKNLKIEMKHANSMLDFIISDIAASNISSVKVTIENTEYTPYQAKTDPVEYLLIVPVTEESSLDEARKKNPIIEITTGHGTVYTREIKLIEAENGGNIISNYTVNTCYCFTLKGLELILSPITITDWSTGKAEAGDYIAVTAYPTFRGTPNETFYLYYDNCLKDSEGNAIMQKIEFNSRGECTIKPDGRVITHISTTDDLGNATALNTNPIVLKDMIVDITEAIKVLTKNKRNKGI